MHYVSVVPYMHFITASALNAVTMTLDLAYDSSTRYSRAAQPVERLHVFDTNIETVYVWQHFLRQLACRPRGPPQRMRITFVDALPRVMEQLCEGRRARAMQVGCLFSVPFFLSVIPCSDRPHSCMDGCSMNNTHTAHV